VLLADNALVELLLHGQQAAGLFLGDLVDGNTGGSGQNLRNNLGGHGAECVAAFAPCLLGLFLLRPDLPAPATPSPPPLLLKAAHKTAALKS